MLQPFHITPEHQYSVYAHRRVIDGIQSTRQMIVLKHIDSQIIAEFTGLEFYSYPYTGQAPHRTNRPVKSELGYICQALNYITKQHRIERLIDITADMVFDFFDYYCSKPKRNNKESYNSQQSLDRCIRAVTNFFANLTVYHTTKCDVKELCREVFTKDSPRSIRQKKVFIPAYRAKQHQSVDKEILRDLPISAAVKLVNLAYIHDPMIAFAIVLQLFAGLRPSEVMNVRQKDSPLACTKGISCTIANGTLVSMKIDLQRELVLRGDGVSVGRIKKEREVLTYRGFHRYLYPAYKRHLTLLKRYPVDPNYKPMFVLNSGKAMTYPAYLIRVQRLIQRYLKPMLESSNDEREVIFARELDSRKLAPHAFRHVFTVMLVLEGLNVSDVQKYRGDSSPESALTYIKNKGDLMNIVKGVHESVIAELKGLDLDDGC